MRDKVGKHFLNWVKYVKISEAQQRLNKKPKKNIKNLFLLNFDLKKIKIKKEKWA